jgi:hypothetical protein
VAVADLSQWDKKLGRVVLVAAALIFLMVRILCVLGELVMDIQE